MFALCDQRSFYASCELVFNPSLRLHARVAIKSLNDGAIIALTANAKKVGVQKFKPYFQQRELCNKFGVTVLSANFQLYGEISRRIMATLATEVPALEIYSIDEAFCDFHDIDNPKELAKHLRNRIWKEQRIEMGVSIAPTKTLAKLGQNATKMYPQIKGVCFLENTDQWSWLAKRLPVNDVWGVGSSLTKILNENAIFTAFDLMNTRASFARKLGGVNLYRTVLELNGIPMHSLESSPPPKQQIIHSRSFGTKTTEKQVLREALANFVSTAAIQLRRQESCAGQIQIHIATSHFDHFPLCDSLTVSIPGGTDDSRRLIMITRQILDRLHRVGVLYAKAGVTLMDIRPASAWQQDLFVSPASALQSDTMKIIDSINARFGRDTVFIAAQGIEKKFASKQDNLSPSFLSSWADLPMIKIS